MHKTEDLEFYLIIVKTFLQRADHGTVQIGSIMKTNKFGGSYFLSYQFKINQQ